MKLGIAGRTGLLVLFYFGSYLLNYGLGFERHQAASAFWLPTGVVLALLLRRPYREWPVYLLATLAAKQLGFLALGGGLWQPAQLGVALCNFIEAAIGASILRGLGFEILRFRHLKEVAAFSVVAVLAAPLLPSAAAAFLRMSNPEDFAALWRIFYVGDSLGLLIAAPLLTVWFPDLRDETPPEPTRASLPEALLLGVALIALNLAIFGPRSHNPLVTPYLVVPLLIWAATRFGPRGATGAVAMLAMGAVALAAPGYGVLGHVSTDLNTRVASLQLYLALAAISTLALSALLQQREAFPEERRRAGTLEALGRLAAGVAHDFNNDLTVIGGWNEVLAGEEASSSRREASDQIAQAVDRASQLTRELLAFSRQEPQRPEVREPAALITPLESTLKRLLGPDIELELELPTDLPPLRVDARSLELALINLSVNARDAMPKGGRLRISAMRGSLPGERRRFGRRGPERAAVCLHVADQGTGIPEEQRGQIFEPFFTTKPEGEGTGLGLATVRSLVEDHGGRIEVESSSAGTSFALCFPAALEPPTLAAASQEASPSASRRPITRPVLLVEDSAEVRRLAVRVLEEAGYPVLQAESVARGLRQARDHAPLGLLLTDTTLPDGRGSELARTLLEGQPDCPVLFVSGYSPERDLGPALVLRKPFRAEDLLRAVALALERPL